MIETRKCFNSSFFFQMRNFFQIFFFAFLTLSFGWVSSSCTSIQDSSSSSTQNKTIEIGKTYKGFQLERIDHLSDFRAKVFYFIHKSSGAKLIFISNDDPNKTFSISFKTPPYDDTGVFHIFEHSVLAGSKRYPSKSLFFDLAASSLASFLNAMTFSAFTTYPFSSKIEQDFFNLLGAYLDAVFYPNVLHNPNIMKREGIRIEWNEKTKKFQYNGIVFSEMKGNFNNPHYHLYRSVLKSLLPKTPYAFSSGGNPKYINQLSFDQIKKTHETYYHPDHSLIYLYGKLDIKKTLALIHENFLKNFHVRKNLEPPKIKLQKVFKAHSIFKSTYPVLSSKDLKGKTFISLNYVLGKDLPLEDKDSLHILGTALFNEENSPGKKLTKRLNLARDILFDDHWGTQENIASIVLTGVSSSKKHTKIKKELEKILKNVTSKGLSQELIESTLNQKEFSIKEALFNSPNQGLTLSLYHVTPQWIHKNYDLKNILEFNQRFSSIREKLRNQNYIKKLIKTYFLKNKKKNLVILSPNPNSIKNLNQSLSQKIKKAIQKKGTEKLKKEDEQFKMWQKALEPQEILNRTPKLNANLLSAKIEPIQYKKKRLHKKHPNQKKTPHPHSIEIYTFPQNTGGINYIDLHFDLSHIPEKNLQDLPLILYLLKKTNTKKRNFNELTQALNKNIGGLSFDIETATPITPPHSSQNSKKKIPSSKLKHFYPYLILHSKFLNQKSPISFNLIEEILTQSLFEPEHQIKSLILELINYKKTSLTDRASYLASLSGEAFFSESAKWMTYIDGHMAEIHLRNLEQKIQKDPKALQKIIQNLKKTFSLLFSQENLKWVSLVGQKEHLENINALNEKLISHLNPHLRKEGTHDNPSKKTNFFKTYKAIDGFEVPSPVQYNHIKIPYFQLNKKFNGQALVYSRILTFEYLLKVIREQNGAYGARASWKPTGIVSLSSYRDPKLKATFDTFESITRFFDDFQLTKKTLNAFIVGTLKPYYTPKSPYGKARDFMDRKLIHMSEKDYQRIKKEILSTEIKNIQKLNEEIKKILPKSKKTLAGRKEKITQEASFVKEKLSF